MIVNSIVNWPSLRIWLITWWTALAWYMLATLRRVSGMQKQSLMLYRLGVVIMVSIPEWQCFRTSITFVLLLSLETALVHVKDPASRSRCRLWCKRIRRQLMRLLEPFRLAMRMVGPEIYKGFHVIVDGQLCPHCWACVYGPHHWFAFLRFIP